jgi:Concanavalin A-like lectin/glucanases superfamily
MAIINFANEVMPDKPIGYWRLGEAKGPNGYPYGTSDASGNGNDGAVIGDGITFGKPGLYRGVNKAIVGDTAALFDGKTGRIIVLNSDSLNPSHLTMEAIVRWDGPIPGLQQDQQPQQRILEKSSYPDLAQYGLSILSDGTVQVELRVLPKPTDPADKVITLTLKSTKPVAQGTGTHIVATYNAVRGAGIINIYLNGDQKGEETSFLPPNSISPKTPTADNLIESGVGIGNQTQRDRPFNGLIDEVALYPTALSAPRILAHYQSQILRPVPIRRVLKHPRK